MISDAVTWGPKIEYICNNVLVTDGGSVTIEEGTTIEFQGSYEVLFEGNAHLQAVGSESDSITFRLNDTITNTEKSWKGFRFQNITQTDDTSKFAYCNFLGAKDTIGIGGAIILDTVPYFIVQHSLFDSCTTTWHGGAIKSSNTVLDISNSEIRNCIGTVGGGIFSDGQLIGDSLIFDNNIGTSSGGALYMENIATYPKNVLKNSILVNNSSNDGGAIVSSFNAEISNCKIINNHADFFFGDFESSLF